MKKLSFLLIILSITLSGCVVAPVDPIVYGSPNYVGSNVYIRPWNCCYYSYPYYGNYYHHWHH